MFLDHKPVLFAGETGTGKTVVVKTTIAGLDQSKFDSVEVNFSAQTTANQTQLSIDGKMENCVGVRARRQPALGRFQIASEMLFR